jgi:hypothetical protein
MPSLSDHFAKHEGTKLSALIDAHRQKLIDLGASTADIEATLKKNKISFSPNYLSAARKELGIAKRRKRGRKRGGADGVGVKRPARANGELTLSTYLEFKEFLADKGIVGDNLKQALTALEQGK